MNKIIFGGAFDPIHLGHINMAKQSSMFIDGDVIFVPSPISVWKSESAPIEHKRKMVELSIKDEPRFSIDDFEINSGKNVNYSIDTVKHFKQKYPNDTLFYLIGTDQVNQFHRWKDADEIAKLVKIIFFDRPGYELDISNVVRFKMTSIPGDLVNASSTDIKDLNRINLSEEVLYYIEENNLYFVEKVKSYLTKERYNHSIQVAHLALKIANKHHIYNGGEAYIAGLLHDIGKNIDKEKAKSMMEELFPEYKDLPSFSYHQFIGSYIAEKEFGITNQDILNSIKYHATGNNNFSNLSKIIYASDKIEPTRGFDSSDLIATMMEDINSGFKKVLQANKDFLAENRKDINNRLTVKCFEEYL